MNHPSRPRDNTNYFAWLDYWADLEAWEPATGEPLRYEPMPVDRREILPRLRGESFAWWDGVDWRTCRCPLRTDDHLKPIGEMDRKTLWGFYRTFNAPWTSADEYRAFRAALNMWRMSLIDSAIAAARVERLRAMRSGTHCVETYRQSELKRLTTGRSDGN